MNINLSISIPKQRYKFFMELIKSLGFVTVEEQSTPEETFSKNDLKQSLNEVKMIREGTLPKQSLKSFLDEL